MAGTAIRRAVGCVCAAVVLTIGAAHAQEQDAEYLWSIDRSLWTGTSIGEDYTVELSGGLWAPDAVIVASSEQFGILGSDINFGDDLGMGQQRHPEFRLAFKPGRRHKLRVSLVPIEYRQHSVLERRLVFQGIAYDVGLPVSSLLKWDAWRIGYEFDVIARDRGYFGLIVEAKYTRLLAEIESDLAYEYTRAQAPIPAIGGIARVYVTRFTPITAEVTAFKLPERLAGDYRAQYVDIDLYATLNLSRMVGVSVGYRSMDFSYLIGRDTGDLKLDGFYLSGVVRF